MKLTEQCATALAAVGFLLIAGTAVAAPEEIEVYMDEMSQTGQFGLDLHANYVPSGALISDYPGEQQSLQRLRVTPEFAYGITPDLEAGLYLPLATLDREGRIGPADGFKLRLKYIAPRAKDQTWFWGANFEIGAVSKKLDVNPGNAELKGIIGKRTGRWTVALNANVDFKVAGPRSAPASLDIDTKISYAVSKTLAVGVETFNGAGQFSRLGSFGRSDQSSFVVIDTSFCHWDVNFGIGSGYGSNPDKLIIKAIIGVPIDWRLET